MNRNKQTMTTGASVRVPTVAANADPLAPWTPGCPATAIALAGALAASSLASANPAELVESARCSMCHHAEAQRVGPSWGAIAERYAEDEAALATLTAQARAGGSGNWGKAPMPPVSEAQLSDADLEAVLAWILDR